MSHSIGTDKHYITRDVKSHRQKYAECYQHLRLSETSPDALVKFSKQLEEKDQQIKSLQEELTQQKVITDTISGKRQSENEIAKLHPLIDFVNGLEKLGYLQIFLDLLKTSQTINLPDKGSFQKINFSKKDLLLQHIISRQGSALTS